MTALFVLGVAVAAGLSLAGELEAAIIVFVVSTTVCGGALVLRGRRPPG